MKRLLLMSVALVVAGPAGADELALRRVMLSSAGVGYFEYQADVTGAVTLGLDVKLDQVDDVLKSIVVFDGAGGVGAVELPGRDDRQAAFGDVPFGQEALGSALTLLNSLQGVEVSVEGPRPMTGRIVRAESVRDAAVSLSRGAPGQEAPARTRVTLLTAAGLRQFVLEDSEAVQIVDPGLRERTMRAIAASRRQSGQDTRHLSIVSRGDAARSVRVSYVAVAPLWKASYRLVLPADDAATARLQGWATLENVSGADWSGVSLALQYGNPVTFHQAIYRSYFVTRPEVPVEVLGRLLPDVDAPARALPPPPPPPSPSPMRSGALARAAAPAMAMAPVPEPMVMAQAAEPVAAAEGATETVFTLPTLLDLAAGHSASVPILDVTVPAARVALAKPDEAHPLAVVRLGNETGASLPAGVLTIYDLHGDAPYAGDARLGGLPQGETRLIAYAQDLRTSIEWKHDDSVTIASLRAHDGVLEVDRLDREVTHATITGPAKDGRHVLVEVAKPDGGTVAPGFGQPVEETASAWRFAVDVAAGETKDLVYAIDTHEGQEITLADDPEALVAVLNVQGLSPDARTALTGLLGLRKAEAARVRERDQISAQLAAVDADETRIRANLGAVQTSDALRTRLLRQLDADETKRAALDAQLAQAETAAAAAQDSLQRAIAAIRL